MPATEVEWKAVPCGDDFTARAGPMMMTTAGGDGHIFQVEIGPGHCNANNVCHGGMIATFVDQAMGMAVVGCLTGANPNASTIGLTVDYIAAALIGDVLETEPRILKLGRSIGFCETLLMGPRGLVARASGTFRIKVDL